MDMPLRYEAAEFWRDLKREHHRRNVYVIRARG